MAERFPPSGNIVRRHPEEIQASGQEPVGSLELRTQAWRTLTVAALAAAAVAIINGIDNLDMTFD